MGVDFILRNGKKIAIFAILIAYLATTVSAFIALISGYVTQVLNSIGLDFVPFFAPSNLDTCLGIVIAIKTAGTVYETGLQLLKWKVDTLA